MVTYTDADGATRAVESIDEVALGIFCVEILIRIGAYGRRPQDFFRSGWNWFDLRYGGSPTD